MAIELGFEDELLGLGFDEETEEFEEFEEVKEDKAVDWENMTWEEQEAFLNQKEKKLQETPQKTSYFSVDSSSMGKGLRDRKEFKVEEFGVNRVINSNLFPKPKGFDSLELENWEFSVSAKEMTSPWQGKKIVKVYEGLTGEKVESPQDSKGLLELYSKVSQELNCMLELGLVKGKNGDYSLLRQVIELFNQEKRALEVQLKSTRFRETLGAVDKLVSSRSLNNSQKVFLLRVLVSVCSFALQEVVPDECSKFLESAADNVVFLCTDESFKNGSMSTGNVVSCLLDSFGVFESVGKDKVTLREGVKLNQSLIKVLYAIPTDSKSLYCWWQSVKSDKTLYNMTRFNCKVTETSQGYCFEEWFDNLGYVRKFFSSEKELMRFVKSPELEPLREKVFDEVCRSSVEVELFQAQEDFSETSQERVDELVLEEVQRIRKEFKINLKLDSDSQYNSLGFSNYESFYRLIMRSLRDKSIYEDVDLKSLPVAYDKSISVLQGFKKEEWKVNYENVGRLGGILVVSDKPEVKELLWCFSLVYLIVSRRGDSTSLDKVFEELLSVGVKVPEKGKALMKKEEFTLGEIQSFFVKPEEFSSSMSYQSRRVCLYKDLYESLRTLRELGFSKKLIASSINRNAIEYQIDPFIMIDQASFREKAYFVPFSHQIHLTDLSLGSLAHELTHAIDSSAFVFVNEVFSAKRVSELERFKVMTGQDAKDLIGQESSTPFSDVVCLAGNRNLSRILGECNSFAQSDKVKGTVRVYKELWKDIEESAYYKRLLSSCLSDSSSNSLEYLLTPTEVLARIVATVFSESSRDKGNCEKIQLIVESSVEDPCFEEGFSSFSLLNPYRISGYELKTLKEVVLRTLGELDRLLPEED